MPPAIDYPSRMKRGRYPECGQGSYSGATRAKKYGRGKVRPDRVSRYGSACGFGTLDDIPSLPVREDPQEEIIAHTTRIVTTSEAAREWDAMTRPPTRTMVILPPDE